MRAVALILLERMIWQTLPTVLEQKNKMVILPDQKIHLPQFTKRFAKLVGFQLNSIPGVKRDSH